MKLSELFDEIIEQGIENDPRGKKNLLNLLDMRNKKYNSMSDKKKEFYNINDLKNPYNDSSILYGNGEEQIKSILVGIDIGTSELLLLDNLKGKGTKIDLVISYGSEMIFRNMDEPINLHAEIMTRAGIPINKADSIMHKIKKNRMDEFLQTNYSRVNDVAKLLDIPFVKICTPVTNMIYNYFANLFANENFYNLDKILNLLLDIEEYNETAKAGYGPQLLCGNRHDKAGKIAVDFSDMPIEILEEYDKAGIGTLIISKMHNKVYQQAQKNHIRIIMAGRSGTLSLGFNLLLDKIIKKHGHINIIPCSGFIRI